MNVSARKKMGIGPSGRKMISKEPEFTLMRGEEAIFKIPRGVRLEVKSYEDAERILKNAIADFRKNYGNKPFTYTKDFFQVCNVNPLTAESWRLKFEKDHFDDIMCTVDSKYSPWKKK